MEGIESKAVQVVIVEPIIMLCAFRYALGRRTFVPTIVAKGIKKNIKVLPTKDLRNIKNEIQYEHEAGGLGDCCDVETWVELKTVIEKELERRKDGND